MIRLVILILAAGLTACASYPTAAVHCPQVAISYIGSETLDGVAQGRFQITTEGPQSLRLPLANVDRQLYAHAATTDIRKESGANWHPFSAVLEEVKPPVAYLVVAPGEVETFLYDGTGAFLPGAVHQGQELSIVVRDLQACVHRSSSFAPYRR